MIANNGLVRLNSMSVGGAAVEYMRLGLPVFPCQPGAKSPATSRGFKDASDRPAAGRNYTDVARTYLRAGYNVAIRTGCVVDVLDVDVKGGRPGLESLHRLAGVGLLLGAVAEAVTPSGGLHVYFPASGARNGCIASIGLDHRGEGGYVLAAPSDARAGDETATYRWLFSRDLGDGAPLDWDAVKRMFRPRDLRRPERYLASHRGIACLQEWLMNQPEGNRNSGLYWAARRALESGLDPHHLTVAAYHSGLTQPEIDATILSAIRGQNGH